MTTQLEYALMSSRAYDRSTASGIVPVPAGWTVDEASGNHNPTTGLDMEVFKKGNDIVMAFAGIKGIDDKTDLADAGLIYMGLVSEQLVQAAEA